MKKLLLHACCGICSGYPVTLLKEMGYEVIVYFCNPNLDTKEEYERRLPAIKDNYERVKQYINPYNFMYEKYLT